MKKIVFIAFFILIGNAQSQAQKSLNPGVRAGVNFSKLTNYNTDFKEGFYVGGELGIKFNKFFTLQPELVYSQQGGDNSNYYDVGYSYSVTKEKYSLDYLSLGVISKFYVSNGFHFLAGPSLDIKVSDSDNFKYGFFLNDPSGVDFCIVGGFGYSFSNGISFEARFKQGMVDIFGNNFNNTDNVDENGNGNYDEVVLNQTFQLGLSYKFNLK